MARTRSYVPTDRQVLCYLREGGDNWGPRVADHFLVGPRTAERILRRLTREGMLREEPPAEPGYLPRFHLTQTGTTYLTLADDAKLD
jgi:DNA-binding IclR family transcriptional regulator